VGTPSVTKTLQQEQALRALESLPPFSPILNRLLATLADEDVSFARLAALIEKDTILAGNVLRVVNSAAYSCRGTVNSVAHAIAIMGLTKLRNTGLSFSVSRMWKGMRCPRGWSMANFNLHSIACAILSDAIAQRVPVHYGEGAFVAGLFHDLGKLLIAVAFPLEYEMLLREAATCHEIQEERERELLGTTHADLSALALERWNLPRLIQIGVAFHHDREAAPTDSFGEARFNLSQVVAAADHIVTALGLTLAGKEGEGPTRECTPYLIALGLEEQAERLLRDFQVEFDAVRKLF
jgi:HD-like signal output (HDOD) protein